MACGADATLYLVEIKHSVYSEQMLNIKRSNEIFHIISCLAVAGGTSGLFRALFIPKLLHMTPGMPEDLFQNGTGCRCHRSF